MLRLSANKARGALATKAIHTQVALSTKHGNAQTCAVLGAQWGDEGKGKLADVLAAEFDVVARFNGGDNAGHTLVVDGKRFAFHLLPCGLIYPHTLNVIGNGCVVHVPQLFAELEPLKELKTNVYDRLKVSNRAHTLFKFHRVVDGKMEASAKLGTTKKGIGPCYASKANRIGIRMGSLVTGDFASDFVSAYHELADAHERMYDVSISTEDRKSELEELQIHRETLIKHDMVVDSVQIVNEAYRQGKRIITEGANAAMLDIDYGTYPYVTSSTTTVGGMSTGLGLAPSKIKACLGVVKAYTTRVGAGPFPTELTDDLSGGDLPRGAPGTEIGKHLQEKGFEIGVTTGRKRRCGWLDCVLLRYSHTLNDYSGLNITKLDVLDDLKELKIAVEYRIDGKALPYGAMPDTLEALSSVEVVYETMKGWQQDITEVREYEDLPIEAKAYVSRIEDLVGAPVSYVGVGPGREAMLIKP